MGDFMDDLDEFKRFVQTKPELATLVHQGKYRWQELYEMYSLYGNCTHTLLLTSRFLKGFDYFYDI